MPGADSIVQPSSALRASGEEQAVPCRFSKRRCATLLGILILLAALPYANSLRNGFVYDDLPQVLNDPYTRDLHHLREIFTANVWSYLGDYRGNSNYYRPLMLLGYAVCYRFFGPRPDWFHRVNLLVHLGVVGLLFLVTRRMFGSAPLAFLAAAIFALHPIHTEPVDWIGAITELELGFFYLLGFWFFLSLPRARGRWSPWPYAGMLASFAAALLSKEQALTFPAVATLYEHLVRPDRAETTWVQKVQRYGMLWLLGAVYIVVRLRIMGSVAPQTARPAWGATDVVIAALALVKQYVAKLFWPARLSLIYVFPEDASSLVGRALEGFLILVAMGLVFALLWKRDRRASFGLVWFLVTLAPVLNARWMATSVFNERYTYLPSVGFSWLLAWAGLYLWGLGGPRGLRERASPHRTKWRVSLIAAAGLLAALSTVRIVARNRDWLDESALYRSALAVSPDSYDMRNNIGTLYWNRGDHEAAEREWREAFRLRQDDPIIWHNLGLVEKERKSYENAVGYFLRALQIKANYADAHLDLGLTYRAMGLRDQARSELQAAVALSPLMPRARNALGELYFDEGRLAEAEEQIRRSIESWPNREAFWDRGLIRWAQRDLAGAERDFKAAERLMPFGSRVHFILGMFYKATGKPKEAVREYRTGLQFDPNNAEAREALAQLKP